MKKVVIVLFITIFALDLTSAQQKPLKKTFAPTVQPQQQTQPTWVGIIAGANLNYLDYHDKITTIQGTNAGFHAGIFCQKNFDKRFGLQPLLLVSVRGGKINDIDSTVNAKLMNLELPVNLLYSDKHLVVGAGPNFCYAISGKLKNPNGERNAYDPRESFERTLKRFQIGGNFMMGYTFKKGILVSANFSPGFTNIYKGDDSAPRHVRANTSTFGFSLGYMLAIPSNE